MILPVSKFCGDACAARCIDSQRELTCAQKKEGSTGRVIYCTAIASPLLIAISRILAGRSNGASMSNPLG